MPKISGANIAEHVAAQETAIIAAATRLFAERGVTGVTTGDIAHQVGLARTSLYRYFPTKASIVYRWFEAAMTPLIDASNAIAATASPWPDRLVEWVNLQLDFLADPDNQAMIRASLETDDMPKDIRAAIGQRHQDLYTSLHTILTAPGTDKTDETITRTRVLLIAGLLRSLADVQNRGIPTPVARQELLRASKAIADGDGPSG